MIMPSPTMVEPIPIPTVAPVLRFEFAIVVGELGGAAAGVLDGDTKLVVAVAVADAVDDVEL